MDFGQNMMLIRKQKKLSRAALGKMIGTSGDVIGRYERGDIKPSVDVGRKLADALEVSLDYLIGKTTLKLDNEALKRLELITKLPVESKIFVLNLVDMALRDFSAKKNYNRSMSISKNKLKKDFIDNLELYYRNFGSEWTLGDFIKNPTHRQYLIPFLTELEAKNIIKVNTDRLSFTIMQLPSNYFND